MMEFSFPVPKQSEILGQFSSKWYNFVSRFHYHQDHNGASKLPFLLHFGANALKDISSTHHLSSEELNKFTSFVEALESECLFQIILTFLRYLFFNHCRRSSSWIEDFYTELKLLSEIGSFDMVAIDNVIKTQIINSYPEERVKNIFLNEPNLTARDVVDICSRVEKHVGSVTPELCQSYLIDHQQKSFLNSNKGNKSCYSWASFQENQPEIRRGMDLSTVFRNESHHINDMFRSSNFIDSGGKMNSNPNVDFTPMDTLPDMTSYIPNKIPQVGVNFLSSEGSSHYLHGPPPVHFTASCQESNIPSNVPLSLSTSPSIPVVYPPATSHKKNSSKMKAKKTVGKDTSKRSAVMPPATSKTSNYDTADSDATTPSASRSRSDMSGLDRANDENECARENDRLVMNSKTPHDIVKVKEESDKTPAFSLEVPKDVNEIPQSFCSQQKAFLKTSQVMESTGQSTDIYSCNFCIYSCPGKAVMEEHALREHESLKCFVCTVCNAKLPTKAHFESHVRIKHMNVEEHKCQICDMVFSCQKKLILHLQGHAKTQTVTCRVCTAMFSTERLLSDHMASVHPGVDRWSCHHCNAGFSTKRLLLDHVVDVHNENGQDLINRFSCKICGINFAEKKSANKHRRKFHSKPMVRKFSCDICSHTCTSNANLISHRRIHTGEKPFICEVCGKEFAQLSTLDKHTRVHTGEKPYKCQYCDLAFKTSSNRLVHERVHRNERPYVCEQCGKKYRNSYELKTHIDTHNEFRVKRYLCHCGAAFDNKKKLNRHEVSHSGAKPYKCEICDMSFTRPENLKGHQKSQACLNRMSKSN